MICVVYNSLINVARLDYILTSTRLTVLPNITLVPVDVMILDNVDLLNFKNFSLILSLDENAARVTTDTTVINIFDDDCE